MMHTREPILIVDDDATTRRLLQLLLGRHGFATETAGDFQSLWRRAPGILRPRAAATEPWPPGSQRQPAVMLLDRHLGAVDTLGLVPALREAMPRTPTVLIPADDSPQLRARAHHAGAQSLLPKPIAPPKLIHTVRAALAQHHRLRRTAETPPMVHRS